MSKKKSLRKTPQFKSGIISKLINRLKPNSSKCSKKEKVEVLSEPIKSVSDKKLYKTIRLENGLTALLISDPSKPSISNGSSSEEGSIGTDKSKVQKRHGGKSLLSAVKSNSHDTKKTAESDEEKLAACALSVGVGSFSDPADIQGLAHFVEHLVFLGSEKYSKENEFASFVHKEGGYGNAYTDSEVTTFYFDAQEKHLPEAMDIFSQFFISPLMKKEAMQREREAIQSEFSLAAPSDVNRRNQLIASLFPEGHPVRTFTWGNLLSLRDDIPDDEKLHKAAQEFRKHHYSAHRMTVAVQARMDLADLEKHVSCTFGQIPTNKLPADDFSKFSFKPELVTPQFKDIYYVKPVGDTTELHLTWCMRSLLSEYETKPHQYVSHLLGHEGRGSLLSYLRKKVWALGIITGNSESGIESNSMYSLFSVQVVLTKKGLDHVEEVLEAIFSYIQMLKKIGPSERIFKELKTTQDTSFRFEEEVQPVDDVESLARNMHFFPPEHYITGDKLYHKFDPKGITSLLDSMTPNMANVIIMSDKYSKPIQYDAKEKWFGTEYKRTEKPKLWLHRWLNVKPYKEFHLPDKNIYITNNFDLVPPAPAYVEEAERLGIDLYNSTASDIHKKVSESEKKTKVLSKGDLIATVKNFRLDQPNLLRKNHNMEVWYKPDFKFRFPMALLYFYFLTPLILHSPRDACLIDLWTDVLQQGLTEELYPATMAGLSHSLYASEKGLTLKVSGYNQNLHLLLELVSREMQATRLTPQLFEAVREERARNYYNILIQPEELEKDIRKNVLLEPYISPRDKAAVIRHITYYELKEFTHKLLAKMYLQVLVQGNLAWNEAITISENVHRNIKWKPLSEQEMPEIKVHELPLGEKRLRVASLNPSSSNSIVNAYYQGEVANPKDTETVELLTMLMKEPVFDTLRTKEQLGYNVFNTLRYTYGVLGSSVTVNTQVDKFTVSHVDQRIEAFLKKFAQDTHRGGEKALAPVRRTLEQLKHTPDDKLIDEVEKYWSEIVSQEYQFQREFTEAEALHQVKIGDINNWIENHFSFGNKKLLRKLSVQIVGNKPKDGNVTAEDTKPKSLTLHYLNASDSGDPHEDDKNFIMDIKEFKKNLPIIKVPKIRVHELPLGEKRVRVESLNPSSTNSRVTTCYQGEVANSKDTATLEVIMMLMEEPVFDTLRTKEQLGYNVFNIIRYNFGVLGFSVTVDTEVDKFSVSYVDQRIEAFLKEFAEDTRQGGEKALAPVRRALEQQKLSSDNQLNDEFERYWSEIVFQQFQFDRLFTEAEAVHRVKIADVNNWIENHFSSGNKKLFRKLSVEIVGNNPKNGNETAEETDPTSLKLHYLNATDSGDPKEDKTNFIMDIDEFKKNLPIINVPKVELPEC